MNLDASLLDGTESERLRYKLVTLDDLDAFQPFFTSEVAMRYYNYDHRDPNLGVEWMGKWIERYENKLGGMMGLEEKKTGVLVGICGLLVQTIDDQFEMEVGYGLLPAYWGKGYASESAQFMRDYGFEHDLADHIISIIHVENAPSAAVAKRNGMTIWKQSTHKNLPVNIHRIKREEWEELKTQSSP